MIFSDNEPALIKGIKKIGKNLLAIIGVSFTLIQPAFAADTSYQLPSADIQALVNAPRGPEFRISPNNQLGLLAGIPSYPTIKEIAEPELKLAGMRLHGRLRTSLHHYLNNDLSILDMGSGKIRKVSGFPLQAHIADMVWSPDEKWVAVSRWGDAGVELWLVDVKNASARRLLSEKINAVMGAGFAWLNMNPTAQANTVAQASNYLLVRLVPPQGAAPKPPKLMLGPDIQETKGGKLAQVRTYPDLLRTPADADRLEWELKTQLALVSVRGEVKKLGPVLNLSKVSASPDGKWLVTTQIKRPFSYYVPIERFGTTVDLWKLENKEIKKIKTLAESPLREKFNASNDAVQAGPRNHAWRYDLPATLTWCEAQGGELDDDNRIHDTLLQQNANALANTQVKEMPQKLMEMAWRFNQIWWGNGQLALLTETHSKTREIRTWRFRPDESGIKPELIFSRKSDDTYAHPGTPVMENNAYGKSLIRLNQDKTSLYLIGQGASPEGDKPFLDRLNLSTGKRARLWQSKAPYYEEVLGVLDDAAEHIIISRESPDERPNLYLRHIQKGDVKALTQYQNPTPQLKGIQKKQIHYEREDGLKLSATLYLPAGYDPKRDGPRPMLMWAYPREYKSSDAASQVSGSIYRYNRLNIQGPQFMLLRGFTVLDGFAMPIVGEGRKEANDTFIKQIKMNAEAAVNEVVKMGVADKNRIAIGGHSYGAFMAANLLAHTSFFKVGIARSGAYNRSLTPFGFQSEDRMYWKAFDTYQDMSPFNYADDIDVPLLLIHGEEDNNPGTQLMQSERLYQALQGLGTPARLVTLPHEQHIYRAKESIMHMLWEQEQWLLKYLKTAKK